MELSRCDLHLWRLIVAVGWSILIQFVLLCLYITLMDIDCLNIYVLGVPFRSLMSVKSLYIILLAALILVQGIVCSRDYLKPPKTQFINKRFLLLFNLFSTQNLVALWMYIALGVSVAYVYASLSSKTINSFSVKCSDDYTNEICLNEKKLFLILNGIWIGIYFFFKDYIFKSKTLLFPPVQQHKFIRIKATVLPCLRKCMLNSVFPCVLFCIVYYFKGNVPRSYISSLSGLRSSHLLESFFILLDKELIVYLWIFTTISIFTFDVMTILFNIHLTERAFFPIATYALAPKTCDTFLLQDALSAENVPIIQHLGFLDLTLLSQFDAQRRAQLFTLSQPGGHPHSWNAIINECFKVIDKFTIQLDKCIDSSHIETIDTCKKPVPKPLDTSACHQRSFNMRNLSTRPCVEYCEPTFQSPTLALQRSYERLIKVYQEWFNKKLEAFFKKPVIAYFFGEMSEPKIKHLLFQSQPVIWAVESLSILICFSLQEDCFGIAQKDLSKIIISLMHLKNSLDKLQKQSIFIKKSNKLDLVDIQMKNAVKFSVKQCIYRIVITFKNFIHDINLSPIDYAVQMNNFVEFKEV